MYLSEFITNYYDVNNPTDKMRLEYNNYAFSLNEDVCSKFFEALMYAIAIEEEKTGKNIVFKNRRVKDYPRFEEYERASSKKGFYCEALHGKNYYKYNYNYYTIRNFVRNIVRDFGSPHNKNLEVIAAKMRQSTFLGYFGELNYSNVMRMMLKLLDYDYDGTELLSYGITIDDYFEYENKMNNKPFMESYIDNVISEILSCNSTKVFVSSKAFEVSRKRSYRYNNSSSDSILQANFDKIKSMMKPAIDKVVKGAYNKVVNLETSTYEDLVAVCLMLAMKLGKVDMDDNYQTVFVPDFERIELFS